MPSPFGDKAGCTRNPSPSPITYISTVTGSAGMYSSLPSCVAVTDTLPRLCRIRSVPERLAIDGSSMDNVTGRPLAEETSISEAVPALSNTPCGAYKRICCAILLTCTSTVMVSASKRVVWTKVIVIWPLPAETGVTLLGLVLDDKLNKASAAIFAMASLLVTTVNTPCGSPKVSCNPLVGIAAPFQRTCTVGTIRSTSTSTVNDILSKLAVAGNVTVICPLPIAVAVTVVGLLVDDRLTGAPGFAVISGTASLLVVTVNSPTSLGASRSPLVGIAWPFHSTSKVGAPCTMTAKVALRSSPLENQSGSDVDNNSTGTRKV